MNPTFKERMLTGDRVTGKLHLGHYSGSLRNRVLLQDRYESFVFLADVQALTTHFDQPALISSHIREITLDYLSAGIDPLKTTIYIQSMIPEIAELTVFFSMFVTVNLLRHNPTVKAEAKSGSFGDMYYGFLGYPVSQAADITVLKATVIPVGEDQLPHLELARRIVRRFNELYRPVFPEPHALLSETPRLPGTDGTAKMSKSLGNSLPLDASSEEIAHSIRRAVTDPARLRKHDPGHPDICPIFAYHQAFLPLEAADIRESCERGSMGCAACKARITEALQKLYDPMRERRAYYSARPNLVDEILVSGTARTQKIARETLSEVREAMSLNYFADLS